MLCKILAFFILPCLAISFKMDMKPERMESKVEDQMDRRMMYPCSLGLYAACAAVSKYIFLPKKLLFSHMKNVGFFGISSIIFSRKIADNRGRIGEHVFAEFQPLFVDCRFPGSRDGPVLPESNRFSRAQTA